MYNAVVRLRNVRISYVSHIASSALFASKFYVCHHSAATDYTHAASACFL
jgi:hypothetical protein